MAASPLKISFVTAYPTNPEANTIYFVKGTRDGFVDIMVVGADPATDTRVSQGINETRVDEMITAQLANFNTALIYDTIAERDADTATHVADRMVFVRDASADPTVDSKLDVDGNPLPSAAFYIFKHDLAEYVKLVDWNDIDVVLKWDNIQGKPNSTPAQIDQAVTDSHTHANKTVLAGFSEDAGQLVWNGAVVSTVVATPPEW